MNLRIINQYRIHFFSIFVVFFYKILLGWRFNISSGYQDEVDWIYLARKSSLLKTVLSYDAGYPTPCLRLISWLFSNSLLNNFTFLHIFNLLVISICVTSIMFLGVVDQSTKVLLILTLSTFPSFDLLLFHNLSYWIFIPCLVWILNLFSRNSIDTWPGLYPLSIIFVLTIAKPQLLLSLLPFIVYFLIRRVHFYLFFSNFILILVLLFILRTNNSSLNLEMDWQSLFYFFLTWPVHFLIVLSPIIVLSINYVSRIPGNSFILLFYWFLYILISYSFFFFSITKSVFSKKNVLISCSYLICLFSLYIFPNSGWSRNNLLTSHPYLELFSRHYLPIEIFSLLILIYSILNLFKCKLFLFLVIFQNFIMQIFLYGNLYKPN